MRTNGNEVNVTLSFRAYDDNYRDRLSEKAAKISRQCGAKVEIVGKYPGWDKTPTSALRDKMCDVWKNVTGEEMKVQRIHAGLECGVLISKKPDLDAASIGPDMSDVHTPKEKLNLKSAEKFYNFLVALLKDM